ncbi:MAG: DUF4256 domain-containing protein [Peptostreptococcaceae bacterium]|nr:DUF4256 domain-containing protein [Peptostreptococcaceae bacterium]
MDKEKKLLLSEKCDQILGILKARFEDNMVRHKGMRWDDIRRKLIVNNEKLRALYEMEMSGGEPDIILYDNNIDEYIFFDCSTESPKGRRSLCYDREALEGRKKNKPLNNAIDMATDMGVEILTEEKYRELQKFGKFDTKTSSWIKTPDNIRKLGGAVFCDCRYDTVFVYHNSAESYYGTRGFRAALKI